MAFFSILSTHQRAALRTASRSSTVPAHGSLESSALEWASAWARCDDVNHLTPRLYSTPSQPAAVMRTSLHVVEFPREKSTVGYTVQID